MKKIGKSTSKRRVKSYKRKGKVIKTKYPNKWKVKRDDKTIVEKKLYNSYNREIEISDLGNAEEYRDPVTGKEVVDAIIEHPPRKNRDVTKKSTDTLIAYEVLTRHRNESVSKPLISSDFPLEKEELMELFSRFGKKNGHNKTLRDKDKIIDELVRKNILIKTTVNGKIVYNLRESNHSSMYVNNIKRKYPDYNALVVHKDKLGSEDLAWFNAEGLVSVGVGDYLIVSNGTPGLHTELFNIFQEHDQALMPDKAVPIVMVLGVGESDPALMFTDLKGNGLLIKELVNYPDLKSPRRIEALGEVNIQKLGRYLGAGVAKDTRALEDEFGNWYVIQTLIPESKHWEDVSIAKLEKAVETTYNQAGRQVVFYDASKVDDRHNNNILVSKKEGKYSIDDIDFGAFNAQSKGETVYWENIIQMRKPYRSDWEESSDYNDGKDHAIEKIVKLNDSGQMDKKFVDTKHLKRIAKAKKKDKWYTTNTSIIDKKKISKTTS